MQNKVVEYRDAVFVNKDQRISQNAIIKASDFISKALAVDLYDMDQIFIETPLEITVTSEQKNRIILETIGSTMLFSVLTLTLFQNSPLLTIGITSISAVLSSLISFSNNSTKPAYYNQSAYFPHTPGTNDHYHHIRLSKKDANFSPVSTLIHEVVHFLGRIDNSPLGKNSDLFLANALETIYMALNNIPLPEHEFAYNFRIRYQGEIFYSNHRNENDLFDKVHLQVLKIIDLNDIEWRDTGMFICGVARALREDNREQDIFKLLSYLSKFDYPDPGSIMTENIAAHTRTAPDY